MTYRISGLAPDPFEAYFDLSDADLANRGIIRKTVDAHPGYPCRITLEDAPVGSTVLLLNHESHSAPTPYRSSYAIYVREHSRDQGEYVDTLPPVMQSRPLAFRIFNAEGMLVGALMALNEDADTVIREAFAVPGATYLHAHNAAHGCFAARVDPHEDSAD